jgi:hypothetical protein
LANLEIGFLVLTLIGLILGCWSILWVRASRRQGLVFLGRCLFIATLLFLGASGILAAMHRAEGVIPLGLSSGFLVIGMLWETPPSAR